jgi:hypothetical protein
MMSKKEVRVARLDCCLVLSPQNPQHGSIASLPEMTIRISLTAGSVIQTKEDMMHLEMNKLFLSHAISNQNGGSGMGFKFGGLIITPAVVQSAGSAAYGLALYLYQSTRDHGEEIYLKVDRLERSQAQLFEHISDLGLQVSTLVNTTAVEMMFSSEGCNDYSLPNGTACVANTTDAA